VPAAGTCAHATDLAVTDRGRRSGPDDINIDATTATSAIVDRTIAIIDRDNGAAPRSRDMR
jgi:hypothetical protein